MTDGFADIFQSRSDRELARFEPAFSIRLRFERVQAVGTMPSGAARGAVYVDDGVISGPMLNGRVVPNSGGDYALFRPDSVISFDAVYMLEADDGTPILMRNRGYLWGRKPGVMDRIRSWVLEGGAPVDFDDYYLRSFPTFECAEGKHDWLMRHVIVGVGERMKDGNHIRYYVLT